MARLGIAVALVLLGAGCGGSRPATRLDVTVTSYPNGAKTTRQFTLGCAPTSGSLPYAARICRDIARHRRAMLAPQAPRFTCAGGPFMPIVDVRVVAGAPGGGFSRSPGCGWPGGTPAAIYYAASIRDTRALKLMEARLRCEDHPAFFAKPTPLASIVACTHGLWTPAAERAIRVAEEARPLALLHPETLFPGDPGVVRCRIPALGRRVLDGLCGVRLSGPASHKLVHFVETWAEGRRIYRHHWTIQRTMLVQQSGAIPPQQWM